MYQTIIEAEQLQELIAKETVQIFDCRFSLADVNEGRTLYDESHIPGAVYAHLDDDLSGKIISGETGRHPLPAVEQFEQYLQSRCMEADKQVVVYDHHHGGVASRLWWMLNWVGHEKVAVLNGGWQRWIELQMPISSERVQQCHSSFKCNADERMIASIAEVESYSANRNDNLTDARANMRYHGINEPIDRVGGHIPGADSKQFIDNLSPSYQWKSKEEIAERFADKTDAIMYCGSGVTACHNILACKYAGLEMPRLYPGSWSEWITDEGRAIG